MTLIEKARELRGLIEEAVQSLDDKDALKCICLYEKWDGSGKEYIENKKLRHNGKLWRVVQAHTSQADWTPDKTPALFVVVSLDEWPEFVQPTGAHDAYKKGDKVTFEGKHYISLIDGNVYSPTAYPAGWQEQA